MATNERECVAGDTVEFVSKKGKIRGVVSRIRFRENRKIKKITQMTGMKYDPEFHGFYYAEVVPQGTTGIWTVPLTMLTVVQKGSFEDSVQARGQALDIKGEIQASRAKIAAKRADIQKERSLFDLQPGDEILVNYRDAGWQKRKFVKYSGSERIGFQELNGKTRFISPTGVKLPEAKK